MLVFTYLMYIYMIPMELRIRTICYFYIDFLLIPKIKENEKYEEMVPQRSNFME